MKVVKGYELGKSVLARKARLPDNQPEQEAAVRDIITAVKERGDAALFEYTQKFDGVKLNALEVNKKEIVAAYDQVDKEVISSLRMAAERIRAYHLIQKSALFHESNKGGVGWMLRPLERVGIHVPGFTAPLPSSVLMTAIPAKTAGVGEVIVATPPQREGTVSPLTLVAADIADVDRVFAVGGAHAVAGLAFGTESVPAVDKVCGPGNVYVSLAKKLLFGVVGIDGIQGPSEVMIIADETAEPEHCAADFLAQAEHASGQAVLVTTSMDLADRFIQEIERQLKELPHGEIAAQSVEKNGVVSVVESVQEAIDLANLYAPEHLLLLVDRANTYVDRVRTAGCIVLGKKATVALGDYAAGPSHVLPTGGTARFGSPLGVLDFVKLTSVITVDDSMLRKLALPVQAVAKAEGLEAHAQAVQRRL